MFACGTGSYQPVCAFIQLGARSKVRDTLARPIPTADGKRPPLQQVGGIGSPGARGGWPASLVVLGT